MAVVSLIDLLLTGATTTPAPTGLTDGLNSIYFNKNYYLSFC